MKGKQVAIASGEEEATQDAALDDNPA